MYVFQYWCLILAGRVTLRVARVRDTIVVSDSAPLDRGRIGKNIFQALKKGIEAERATLNIITSPASTTRIFEKSARRAASPSIVV